MIRSCGIAALTVLLLLSSQTLFGQDKTGRPASLEEARRAAKNSGSSEEQLRGFQELSGYSIVTEDDLKAAYHALVDLEEIVNDENSLKRTAVPLANMVEKSTAATLRHVVSELLERENRKTPLNYLGPARPNLSDRRALKEAVHSMRLMALIHAAGNSRNELALASLRDMQKKGGIPADLAASAIGKIGSLSDLDEFIAQIKRNPRSRIDLSDYGEIVLDRLMQQIDSDSLSEREKQALIPHLGQIGYSSASDRVLRKYARLLSHKNSRVVKAAAEAMSERIGQDHSTMALMMTEHPNKHVRFHGLVAINRIWSAGYASRVQELLSSDPSEDVRAEAAHILGERRVRTAESALRRAANDSSSHVRSYSRGALDLLSGEADRRIIEDQRRKRIAVPEK